MIFDYLVRAFLCVLPFHVILSVFAQYRLGLSFFPAYKEVFLLVGFCVLAYHFVKEKRKIVLDKIDWAVIAYCFYLLFVSFVEGVGFRAIFFGARYDMEFLAMFLLIKHGTPFLSQPLSYYLKLFLISGGIALAAGFLVRFVFKETVLLYFGFSPNLSTWSLDGSIPIYHGIEWASVRRFQGIFDGPNQAAFFLLVYLGVLVHYFRTKKEYWFLVGIASFIILGLLFLTYSRSALLGVGVGVAFVFIKNGKLLWKKYRSVLFSVLILLSLVAGIMYLRYGANIQWIVMRAGSSKWHYERMVEGINQSITYPFGKGLASSGPAFRHAYPDSTLSEKEYIPESWYIQQLVEGGWISLILFCVLLGLIFWPIQQLSTAFWASLIAVGVMNIFLHAFEASYVSLLLFALCGLFVGKRNKKDTALVS